MNFPVSFREPAEVLDKITIFFKAHSLHFFTYYKYIGLNQSTNVEEFLNDVIYGYWNINKPKLLLSVTGGAKKFSIDEEVRTAFKNDLMKVAKATDALIISGGTNYGVMRLVGDAVIDNLHTGNVMGIATWSTLAQKERLIVYHLFIK